MATPVELLSIVRSSPLPKGGDMTEQEDDTELLRAVAVAALAALRQVRTPMVPGLVQAGEASNSPYPLWPPLYQGVLDPESFELLEDFLHLDVCVAPFWPVGNANCPLYRITTLDVALKQLNPAREVLLSRSGDDIGAVAHEDDLARIITRAHERASELPRETFLLWKLEAEQLAEQFQREQLESYERFIRRSHVLRRTPELSRLADRLDAGCRASPVPLGGSSHIPAEVREIIEKAIEELGAKQVRTVLNAVVLPVSAETWDAMLALASGERGGSSTRP